MHVVLDKIAVTNLHTFGGLRLESSPTESLVVKFAGPNAGLSGHRIVCWISTIVSAACCTLSVSPDIRSC